MQDDLLISDENLMKRKRVASNATKRKIPRSTATDNSQVISTAVGSSAESSAVEDPRFGGHKSVLFFAYVAQKQYKEKVILDYLDPPVHEESILLNENMSPADFVLQPSTHDNHLLAKNERDFCIDSVKRLKFIYLHRHFFHRILSTDEVMLLVQDYRSDKHLFLVIMGGVLTNTLWCMTNSFQMDKEKFAVALGYCKHRFGTFTVGFERVPVSNIRLEHLLLLPI
jgi:hypothetical protein